MANTNIADSEKIIVVLRLCMSDDGCILKREEGIKYAYELRVLINKEAMAAKAAAEAAHKDNMEVREFQQQSRDDAIHKRPCFMHG